MKKISILFSLLILLCGLATRAKYQEQNLIPVENGSREVRKLPSQTKRYPILDEFEKQLYPGRNFHKDTPSERLGRIEIAVFGSKHEESSVKSRLTALELELEAWQIAQGKVPKYTSPKPTTAKPEAEPAPYFIPPAPVIVQRPSKKQIDYDYMNYRMMVPLVQTTLRRGIGRMFKQ